MKIKDIIKDFMIMPQTIKPLGLIHKPGTGPNNRFDFINKGNNRANEDSSDEAYELLGQKDPAIRKYVADLGLQNDQASVNKVVPMIDKARQTTITNLIEVTDLSTTKSSELPPSVAEEYKL